MKKIFLPLDIQSFLSNIDSFIIIEFKRGYSLYLIQLKKKNKIWSERRQFDLREGREGGSYEISSCRYALHHRLNWRTIRTAANLLAET